MKILITTRGNDVADDSNTHEGQENLPCRRAGFTTPDTIAVLIGKHIDARHEEECRSELHSQSDGNVTDHIAPTANVSTDSPYPGRRKHKRLVVYASGRWVHAGNFSQGRSNTEDDERHENPTPDDNRRTTALQGIVERCCETVGN